MAKKYLNDYTLTAQESKRGKLKNKAVYTGDYYAYAQPFLAKRLRVILLIASVMACAGFILSCAYSVSNMQYYVLIPFVPCGLCAAFAVIAAVETFTIRKHFKNQEVAATYSRIKKCGWAMLVLGGITLIGEAINIGINASTVIFTYELMFILGAMICTVSGLILALVASTVRFLTIENIEGKKVRATQKEYEKIYSPAMNAPLRPKKKKAKQGKKIVTSMPTEQVAPSKNSSQTESGTNQKSKDKNKPKPPKGIKIIKK